MLRVQASLRQFAEWVISLWRKLNDNTYFKTEFVIGIILLVLCLTNVLIMTLSLRDSQLKVASVVLETVSRDIPDSIERALDPSIPTKRMLERLEEIRSNQLVIVTSGSILLTIVFGYVIAMIAIAPTRHALAAEKQFIGNIAHELRTPLSIIRANSEIILLENQRNPDMTSMVKSNIEELDRLSGIINNLLTINTFRSVKDMHFQLLDYTAIVKDAVDKFEELARNKNITLDSSEINNSVHIWGNSSGVAQITMNLIKNAIIYTLPGGKVKVSLKHLSNYIAEFTVEDTGIGIEREKLRYIFEPFFQVDPSRSQSQYKGSSGLGLTIVNELVKLHRGKILMHSTPKVGTTIKIELPIKKNRRMYSNKKPVSQHFFNEISADFSN